MTEQLFFAYCAIAALMIAIGILIVRRRLPRGEAPPATCSGTPGEYNPRTIIYQLVFDAELLRQMAAPEMCIAMECAKARDALVKFCVDSEIFEAPPTKSPYLWKCQFKNDPTEEEVADAGRRS